MIRSKDTAKSIEDLNTLGLVTKAYGKIASNQMMERRRVVLQSRIFIEGMSPVFDEIRNSYQEEVKKASLASKKGLTFLAHNGKTASVLLSANAGLYGEIINEVFSKFVEEVRNADTEVTIVGRQGLSTFKSVFPKRPYTFFDMQDVNPTKDYILRLVRHIVKYTEIRIYYGLFESIVSQKPKMISINSEIVRQNQSRPAYKYIVEPDIKTVLTFFEAEMFMSLINQTISEGVLAKLASRVVSMDEATEKIGYEKKKMRLLKRRMIHTESDKRQLNSLLGVSMFY